MARRFEIEGIITALLTPLTKDEQIKEALKLRGIDTGTVSSPLRSMDEEEIKTLKEDLKKLRVI